MIKHIYRFLLLIIFLQITSPAFAEKYPRNYNVDILHYKFELDLSDETDEISGRASITIQFKKNDVKVFRLDLINKTFERKNKGMEVESVTLNGETLVYSHKNDELLIYLAKAPVAG